MARLGTTHFFFGRPTVIELCAPASNGHDNATATLQLRDPSRLTGAARNGGASPAEPVRCRRRRRHAQHNDQQRHHCGIRGAGRRARRRQRQDRGRTGRGGPVQGRRCDHRHRDVKCWAGRVDRRPQETRPRRAEAGQRRRFMPGKARIFPAARFVLSRGHRSQCLAHSGPQQQSQHYRHRSVARLWRSTGRHPGHARQPGRGLGDGARCALTVRRTAGE